MVFILIDATNSETQSQGFGHILLIGNSMLPLLFDYGLTPCKISKHIHCKNREYS